MMELRQSRDRVEVVYGGRVILCHSAEQPLLTLGLGRGRYNMRHGSFKIRDQVQERTTLTKCTPAQTQGKITLNFGQATVYLEQVGCGVKLTFTAPGYNRLWMNLPATGEEAVFGCGEQFSRLNLRGSKVPIWCQEQGIGRGRDLITLLAELTHGAGGAWHTTYFPQPTFITTANRFCHVEATAYLEFDFTNSHRHQVHCWEIPQAIFLGSAEDPPQLLQDLTNLLGRQPALPDWANDGAWLGIQGGRDLAQAKLDSFQAAGGKVAAIWCQDWQGIRMTSFGKQLMWDWRQDQQLYPGLSQWTDDLKQQGIRFLGYINTFLALEGELYCEAASRGYTVKHPDDGEYHVQITDFPAALLDLSNPEARAWIKGVIKEKMLGVGLSGWMADFGEYMPVDAVLHSGESGETFHNKYPAIWAQVNREAVEEAGRSGDVTFFCRAGYSGTSAHAPLIWAGDQLVNWSLDDGLASVIPAAISSGLSGIGHHCSDIGGYTTIGWIKRGKELFMRWAEQAAFSAVMRTHEGNRPDVNHQFDTDRETLEHFARMSRVHVALKPYLRLTMADYQECGLPVIRHLWLHYDDDSTVYDLKYQYLLGRDLLVAPVVKRGAKRVQVYLPRDQWIHLWTGKEYMPGWCHVDAPLGFPAVFQRKAAPESLDIQWETI